MQNQENAETLEKLESLERKMKELMLAQKKAVCGYDYINATELAELLGESIKTIYARVHNRQLPFYKPGGKLLMFKLDEIKEWINSARHAPSEEIWGDVGDI